MIIQNIVVNACTPQTIVIGRRTTYDTLQIVFDLSYLAEAYGSGAAVLVVKRSQDETAYPATVAQEGNTLTWTISEVDTYYVGAGECELMWYVDGGLAKTIIYPVVVMRDILQTTEAAPDAYENWVESLTALGAETQQHALDAAQSATDAEAAQTGAEAAADRAEDALEEFTTPTASATSLAPEAQATAAYSSGHFTFGIPRGAQGATGATPDLEIGTVETLEPDQPATATITGTPENPVLNLGIPKGEKGEGGGGGAVKSVNGKTGVVVLTAADVGAGTYSKPSGGIPKTDLAAAVQTSLGKADTALQTAPVSSVAGKTGAVTLDAGDAAFSDSATYSAGTVGAALSAQKNAISQNKEAVADTQSMIATVEATTTASKNYAVGDLLVYDGKLYEVTSAIATGATIIVGSNVAQTTVEDQIGSGGAVDDVQINGTSIVSSGVANIPIATDSSVGVVRADSDFGTGVYSQRVFVARAYPDHIKAGTQSYRPITPIEQHTSTFYGLAKAAGDTTQSASANTVGTYTDDAKAAIQTMLGVAGIVGTVEGSTASKAYAVGDAFLHSGALYKATTSIALGDAITPGTNCTQTTLISIIKGE